VRRIDLYLPPIGIRIRNWGLLLLLAYFIFQMTAIDPAIISRNLPVILAASALLLAYVILNLWLYPNITTTEQELRVYKPWGSYRAIPWGDVTEIRPPRRPAWMFFAYSGSYAIIKANNLPFIYAVLAFLFDNGGRGFYIFRFQQGYANLIDEFRERCPWALAPELKKD
jgi:hypothetical protein